LIPFNYCPNLGIVDKNRTLTGLAATYISALERNYYSILSGNLTFDGIL
jgi:hypothetical protein